MIKDKTNGNKTVSIPKLWDEGKSMPRRMAKAKKLKAVVFILYKTN